jgi:hypothetical protein
MKKTLVFILLLSSIALADSKPTVTKLTIRYIAPDLASGAAGAKPKTFYLAADRYARIEQETDALHSPNLIIVNEPDVWLIDLATRSGSHSVNPGPDLTVHNPILGADSPEELFDFEFGHELEFLTQIHAKLVDSKEIRGTQCTTREFEAGGYLVIMYLDAKKSVPVELKAFKNGDLIFRIEYLNYDSGLPFDPSLFKPPKEVTLTEQKQ